MDRKTWTLAFITAIICMIMFAAGLKPEGYRLYNTASWLKTTNGIDFGRLGIAYSENYQSPVPESLSIELAIKPPLQHREHLDVILDFWDTRRRSHAALCQWDSTLMVMKSPSKYFKNSGLQIGTSVSPEKVCFVTITSCRNHGTDLYINGIHRSTTNRFDLCDTNGTLGHIVLGNSAGATNPWNGELYSLSLHCVTFCNERVLERYQIWKARSQLPIDETTIASYTFDERSGKIARDRSGEFGNITIPALFSIPQKHVLSMAWEDFKLDKSYALDVVVNLFGFVPFGFFFTALLSSIGGSARRHRLIICILLGAGISLFFELTQAYIPTRSSQMSDLILNVLGTVGGAIIRCGLPNSSSSKQMQTDFATGFKKKVES
jgi:hypothetical protein